jgi:hypothetical protein
MSRLEGAESLVKIELVTMSRLQPPGDAIPPVYHPYQYISIQYPAFGIQYPSSSKLSFSSESGESPAFEPAAAQPCATLRDFHTFLKYSRKYSPPRYRSIIPSFHSSPSITLDA